MEEIEDGVCCGASVPCIGSFKIEAIIGVDERGQLVLPKDVREKANIRQGEKLAVVNWERGGKVCCITLIKVEDLAEMIKGSLGPVLMEILGQKEA